MPMEKTKPKFFHYLDSQQAYMALLKIVELHTEAVRGETKSACVPGIMIFSLKSRCAPCCLIYLICETEQGP